MLKNNTLAIALAALLVGGVATAAFMNNRGKTDAASNAVIPPASLSTDAAAAAGDQPVDEAGVPASGKVEYADVVDVKPITKKETMYAQVIGTEPVKETSTTSTPREVCNDVVVQERLPEKDGNVGGTVAGAVIGGLLGNQVGSGNGRTLATIAGAVGGGYAGNEVEKRTRTATTYQVRVRMENGQVRNFPYNNPPNWRQGDRVRVVDGSLQPN